MPTRSPVIAALIALLALGLEGPAAAQSPDDIVNRLLQSSPRANTAAPAPATASDDRPLYRHFDAVPEVEEIVQALLPLQTTRDMAAIPDQQRTTGGFAVPFNYNSDTINPEARSYLDKIGPALKDPRLAGYRFALIGHTDATGSNAYNLPLSQRRSRSVMRYLADTWTIEPARIETTGRGELAPQFLPATDGRNRRVEIQVAGRGY